MYEDKILNGEHWLIVNEYYEQEWFNRTEVSELMDRYKAYIYAVHHIGEKKKHYHKMFKKKT